MPENPAPITIALNAGASNACSSIDSSHSNALYGDLTRCKVRKLLVSGTWIVPMAVTSLREKQKALTREMLVDAAYAAFEEKSYVDTTVDDIVRGASASRPTFYAHFDSKADVLAAVVLKLKLREE